MKFLYDENLVKPSVNYMDSWILSFTQSLVKFVREEMAGKLQYQNIFFDKLLRKTINNNGYQTQS